MACRPFCSKYHKFFTISHQRRAALESILLELGRSVNATVSATACEIYVLAICVPLHLPCWGV
eukprot:7833635-Pyramimonas_sp.AAC.1